MASRNDLVTENLGLVHACCHKFTGRGIEYDDLYQVGCIGLIKAADRFDESLGFRFSTYAVPVILGEIKRMFRDTGPIKVSRSLKELAMRIVSVKSELEHRLDHEPTVSEIAEEMNLSSEAVAEALCATRIPDSLTACNQENSMKEVDLAIEDETEAIAGRVVVQSAMKDLSDEDRELIRLRYFELKTQSEIAQKLNMTQVQVSRKEKRILLDIRRRLE